MPVDFFEAVDELMHNRLAPGSMLKVDIAFTRYWKPVAAANGWDEIIATDDPDSRSARREEPVEHEWPNPRCEREHREGGFHVRDVHRKAW